VFAGRIAVRANCGAAHMPAEYKAAQAICSVASLQRVEPHCDLCFSEAANLNLRHDAS